MAEPSAMMKAVRQLLDEQAHVLRDANEPIQVVIAGGVAVNYWAPSRATTDVNAEFSRRVVLTSRQIAYTDEQGVPRVVYFDTNYHPTLGSMHEDYLERASSADGSLQPGGKLQVFMLSPVDLAVSKLSRFAEHDQDDIDTLARAGLVDCEQFKTLAAQAIDYYVGDRSQLEHNFKLAVELLEQAEVCKPVTQGPGKGPSL